MTFNIGDTVKDVRFGGTYCVSEVDTWYGHEVVSCENWFSDAPQEFKFYPRDLTPVPCPPQPSEAFISVLVGPPPEPCRHERRSFIGLVSGRWACASCGEWLKD